jgi:hypothetical protein
MSFVVPMSAGVIDPSNRLVAVYVLVLSNCDEAETDVGVASKITDAPAQFVNPNTASTPRRTPFDPDKSRYVDLLQ